jgi:hypothetical protein
VRLGSATVPTGKYFGTKIGAAVGTTVAGAAVVGGTMDTVLVPLGLGDALGDNEGEKTLRVPVDVETDSPTRITQSIIAPTWNAVPMITTCNRD